MKLSTFAAAAVLGSAIGAPLDEVSPRRALARSPAPPAPPAPPAGGPPAVGGPSSSIKTDALALKGGLNLAAYLVAHGLPNTICNKENAAVRREW